MSSGSVNLGTTVNNEMSSSVTQVTANSPLSVLNSTTTPVVSISQSNTSTNGYLSSTDWNNFNGKQASGNYITALTGDVTATGPGSVPASLNNAPSKRYIDFLSGNDSTGTGSLVNPWKTLQHAYNSVTDASINKPYVFYLSGGNNDSDSTTITGKPNVSLVADYTIQVSQPLTISGGSTNDNIEFTNITFVGAVTWTRNDATEIGVSLNNCEFFSGPVLKQSGTGSLSITANNSVFVNLDVLAPNFGSFFTECSFLGTSTFEDVNTIPYYEILGGYIGGTMSFSGGPYVYFSGVQADVPFGYTLTATTTANGTPTFQSDGSSIPPTITGSPTIILTSFSQHESYTPATSSDWATSNPTNVKQALDRMANLLKTLNGGTPIP